MVQGYNSKTVMEYGGSIKDADIAHRTDTVKWWNRKGRQYGAKAPEVRK